jgi:hypothetical protein
MKLPRSSGTTAPWNRHRRHVAPRERRHQEDLGQHRAPQRDRRKVRRDQDRERRGAGDPYEGPPPPVQVGEPADVAHEDERRHAAEEVGHGELGLGDPDVGDEIRRDERHDQEPGEVQRHRQPERTQMVAASEDGSELRERRAAARRFQVRSHARDREERRR